MHKALLKVILALFLFSVIDQDAYSVPYNYGNHGTDCYRASIKIQALASSLNKVVHQGVIAHPVYGSIKPLWIGDLNVSGDGLTIARQALFLQNQRHVIHRQQFIRSLLFPCHFFW
ncbi:hypothetical protein KXD93_03215 [Mucilaginibacter sp. BJC16-A38]|uniref:hypothetical protein n=1 Tax=Mucilaginibacter phenanthrenivorans TaxID=1234842 RepID=UPI0021571A76|nr:hypothetical protein [Mucilaginibacter phenanthrenivorans]MCR8556631.1 hypothetical protein [Mucilaginibacter phenanthrenivorans]